MFCCLLELVAAPGLTFKASNAAFQAALGGEHGLRGEVIKAKMPRRAGNSQESRGLYPPQGHIPTRQYSCPSQGYPESLTDSEMDQGHSDLSQRNCRSWVPPPQHRHLALWGLPEQPPILPPPMLGMFLREPVVHYSARTAEWGPRLEQPESYAQCVCSQQK